MPKTPSLAPASYRCPLCHSALLRSAQSWRCDNGHCFDIAKQGYCNLLPVQHKKSLAPGDDKAMVQARKRFLQQGHYQPLAEQFNRAVIGSLQRQGVSAATVVDAGCGEGYYSAGLEQALANAGMAQRFTALDISKFALQVAARRSDRIDWFVANSSRLPLPDHSCDVLCSLFAPIPAVEFRRVLKPGGRLFIVATGKDHLIELREKLYQQVNDKVLEPARLLADAFQLIDSESVGFQIELTESQSIADLLAMTPHYWRAAPEKKQQLQALTALNLTVDVTIYCFEAV